MLQKVLKNYTSNLRLEISRTDDLNYRTGLQQEFDALKSIEDRLGGYVGRENFSPDEIEDEKKAG
ncbi:MAG: hypothetical protein ACJ763_15860 [Bdellovibrionia bacterium]